VTYPGGPQDPQQPYQQPHVPPQPYEQPQPYQQPYQQPAAPGMPYQQPYEQPTVSGVPYQQPVSGQPYAQPGQPYAQPGQPYVQPGQYAGQPGYGPPTGALPLPAGGQQRGGKWALIIGGALLALILVVVGGYFTYQRVFVDTPTEVAEAFLTEATKSKPDPDKLARHMCKKEADEMREDVADGDDLTSSSTVQEWHTTGETVSGETATVTASVTVKSRSGKVSTDSITLSLIKEDSAWKVCGFD
jgi:hypothetical protein